MCNFSIQVPVTGKSVTKEVHNVTDEGYSHDSYEFWIEGDTLFMSYTHEARDCDGKHYRSSIKSTLLSEMQGPKVTKWNTVS
jgi:hypothetical protein